MGILAFGMRHPRDLSIGAGIAVAAWGPILYILSFKVINLLLLLLLLFS